MVLSYTFRVYCIFTVSLGGLIFFTELLLRATASLLLAAFGPLSMRQRERMLYLLQLVPVLFALLGTVCWSLPQYLKNETNRAPEGVGALCLALTGIISCWFAWSILRGLGALIQTVRFRQACERSSTQQSWNFNGTSVMTLPYDGHYVALVGLLRPFIFLSYELMKPSSLAPEALKMVLAHEHAHATQFDNWKLLSLRLVPSLKFPLRDGKTWEQLWQSSAEWAADDDASQNDGRKAILLAEALLVASRSVGRRSAVIQTFLTYDEVELVLRVRRLLNGPIRPQNQRARRNMRGLIIAAMALSSAVVSLMWLVPSLRTLPEHFLHLG